MKFVLYSVYGAYENGVTDRADYDMESLGFKVLASFDSPFFDCWVFCVEDSVNNLPEYMHEINTDDHNSFNGIYFLDSDFDDCYEKCKCKSSCPYYNKVIGRS